MKIGILSRNRNLYSTRRLFDAARARGHHVIQVDTMRAALALGYHHQYDPQRATVQRPLWNGLIPRVDAIIPRIGSSITAQGIAVVHFFESHAIPTTASAEAIAWSRSKGQSLDMMRAAALPVPQTMVVSKREELERAIATAGGFPLLIKLNQGTHGRGVWLVPNMATAVAIQTILLSRGHTMLVQEFIKEARGKDQRLIIVGRRCIAAMERQAPRGEFRANLHQGGTAVALQPPPELEALAVNAAHVLGLAVAGVDLVQSARGPLLLEVNSSPGLEGIEGATGRDVATAIVRYLEDEAGRKRGRNRQRRIRRRRST